MPDIARQIRIGSKQFLDFDTKNKLLQREQERKSRQAQQDAMNENITRLALNLESPAGVAATQRILGGGFDPAQELNFRRLKSILPESLREEQYDVLNPLAVKAGFGGRFGPSALSKERVLTQQAQTGTAQAQTARTKELERIARENQKLRENESKARLSEINIQTKINKARFIGELGKLADKVKTGRNSNSDVTQTLANLDALAKAHSEQLQALELIPDFRIENPDYDPDDDESPKTLINPKYDPKIQELNRLKKQTIDKKAEILNEIVNSTKDAQKIDKATGGALAGNVADKVQQEMLMNFIAQEFPQLAAQMKQEQAAQAEQVAQAEQAAARAKRPTPLGPSSGSEVADELVRNLTVPRIAERLTGGQAPTLPQILQKQKSTTTKKPKLNW